MKPFNELFCIDSRYSLYAKERAFLPEEGVNVSRGEEDLTKCCNTETSPGECNRAVGIVNPNK